MSNLYDFVELLLSWPGFTIRFFLIIVKKLCHFLFY